MSKEIEVLGLGSGDINHLPLGIYRKLLETTSTVYVRTFDHPVINVLKNEGVHFKSFDYIYEEESGFSIVYNRIADTLLKHAQSTSVIYAVPGHPMLAERTVQLLLNQQEVNVKLAGGQSYLDTLFTSLKIDPIDGFQFVDGTHFHRSELNFRRHLIFCQVYDKYIASDIKLTLLEDLPAEFNVIIADSVGTEHETIIELPLEELDRSFEMSNLTTLYIPPVEDNLLNHTFSNLRHVIAVLRGPNGCPWDRRQTHKSLRRYAIEEVYELIDAIDEENDEGIIEELGDVLLQVMLHSQIGEDEGYFTVDDVIKSITEKMIYRHPHVFSNHQEVNTESDGVKTWEQLKQKKISVLDRVPKHAPSLQRAYELQQEASKVGFNWDNVEGAWEKFYEELDELNQAIRDQNKSEIEKEFGDVVFILTNIALFFKVNPELALNQTNNKFISRFSFVEEKLGQAGKSLEVVSLEEMDKYWEKAKRKE